MGENETLNHRGTGFRPPVCDIIMEKEGAEMKFGIRKPSIRRSIRARTTGRAKRAVKRAVLPAYGRKGMGWVKSPRRAAYNKAYHKTSFSLWKLFK